MINRLELLRNKIDMLIKENRRDNDRYFFDHLYSVSHFCSLLALRRGLKTEIAATCGMLHDIAQITQNISENHALIGGEEAALILKSLNAYSIEEIEIISTAISKHSNKKNIDGPYDELLKDADVLHHCLYDTDIPVIEKEIERYRRLLIELGCTAAE